MQKYKLQKQLFVVYFQLKNTLYIYCVERKVENVYWVNNLNLSYHCGFLNRFKYKGTC